MSVQIPVRTNSVPDLESDRTKTNAIFSRLQRRASFHLPQTLHGGRARHAHPKRWEPFFDPIHSFSARGQNVDPWPLSKNKYRQVGKQWPCAVCGKGMVSVNQF